MFGIGLTIESSAVRRGALPILAVGVISTLAFVGLAWPVTMLFGPPAPDALVIAMALSMSSTAVLLRILQQRRELRKTHGRLCVGISIAQDMLSVLLLAMLPLIAAWAGVLKGQDSGPEMSGTTRLLTRGALGLIGIGAMLAAGRYLLPRLMQFVARTDAKGGAPTGELVLVLAAAVAIGSALFTGMLGFSPEMGAFLAGFMLSLTPYRHQLAGQLAPLRDLLMAVFFTAVGLRLDPSILAENWLLILLGLVALVSCKAILIGCTAWAFGATVPVSVLAGTYLAQAGEFSLVILGAGEAAGIFAPGRVGNVVAIVVLSLVITPLLVGPAHAIAGRTVNMPLARWIRRSALREAQGPGGPAGTVLGERFGLVIIAGFGPVGRNLAERFTKVGVPFTVIELNPSTVRRQTVLGRSIIYGDVTNPEVLESAGIREAEAVILTIPDEEAMLRACAVIRKIAPGVFIGARANFLSQGIKARQMGADYVLVEEVVTAEAMAKEVLEHLARRKGARPPEELPAPVTPDATAPP
jgi:CPA2 family monovalent cation:H+ antiporter-2